MPTPATTAATRFLLLFKRTIGRCFADRTPMLAAGLAFYTLLSLAPGLGVVIAIAGIIIGRESAREQVLVWTREMVGARGATAVSGVLDQVEDGSSVATIVGILSMFFGASLFFSALSDSLDQIWRVRRQQQSFLQMVTSFFTTRLLSFTVVLLGGVLMVASLALSAVAATVERLVPDYFPGSGLVLDAANFVISFGLMMLLFATIYRVLSRKRRLWHDIWVGAFVTAGLFAGGTLLIGLYLRVAGLTSAYGAAGSLVAVLLWVYYSAQILLFGAEFTEVYAHNRSPGEEPSAQPGDGAA